MSFNLPSFKNPFAKANNSIAASNTSNNQPMSAKKADKIARKLAMQEAVMAMKNPAKARYWNWQKVVLIFITFVVLFGFVFYTIAPILFR